MASIGGSPREPSSLVRLSDGLPRTYAADLRFFVVGCDENSIRDQRQQRQSRGHRLSDVNLFFTDISVDGRNDSRISQVLPRDRNRGLRYGHRCRPLRLAKFSLRGLDAALRGAHARLCRADPLLGGIEVRNRDVHVI